MISALAAVAMGLGVVGMPVGVRHLKEPTAGKGAVWSMPATGHPEIGRSRSPADDRVFDPEPPVEDGVSIIGHWKARHKSLPVGRDIAPSGRAVVRLGSKGSNPARSAANILEIYRNDILLLPASGQHSLSGGDHAKNRPLGIHESLVRFVGMNRRAARVEGGGDGGSHSDKAQGKAPSGNPCLLVGENGHCVGGVRRTSLLYQIVASQAVLLGGLLAGYGFFRSFPVGRKFFYPRWLAIATTGMVAGCYGLIASIGGEAWLFGL